MFRPSVEDRLTITAVRDHLGHAAARRAYYNLVDSHKPLRLEVMLFRLALRRRLHLGRRR